MHPINNDFFGLTGMKVTYSLDGSTTVAGHIVRQIGTDKYVVAPGNIGIAFKSTYATITLAETAAELALLPAHVGTIVVTVFGGGTEHASKILGRTLRTVEGHTYFWRKTTASKVGECNVSGDWVTGPDAAGYPDHVNV